VTRRALALAGCLLLGGCASIAPRSPEERLAADLLSGAEGREASARQILADADGDSRRAVARVLTRALADAAGRDPELASRAGRALSSLGREAVTGAAKALAERDYELELSIAAGKPPRDLGQDDGRTVPYTEAEVARLVRDFRDRDAAIIAELSAALAAIGRPAVFELLSEASESYKTILPPLRRTAPLMRDAALAALDSLGEPALPELVDSIRYPRVRDAGMRAIGGAGAEGVRVLMKALESRDPAIAKSARAALAEAVQRAAPEGSERAAALASARKALGRSAGRN
jgi:hypothetical protein